MEICWAFSCRHFRPGSGWQRLDFGLYLITLGGGGASVPAWGQSSQFYTQISSFQHNSTFKYNPSPYRQQKKRHGFNAPRNPLVK